MNSSKHDTWADMQRELSGFEEPGASLVFVNSVMDRIEQAERKRYVLRDFLQLQQWASGAVFVLLLFLTLMVREPVSADPVSLDSLLFTEIADESLFLALVDASSMDGNASSFEEILP